MPKLHKKNVEKSAQRVKKPLSVTRLIVLVASCVATVLLTLCVCALSSIFVIAFDKFICYVNHPTSLEQGDVKKILDEIFGGAVAALALSLLLNVVFNVGNRQLDLIFNML